jgi:hypothetical protein
MSYTDSAENFVMSHDWDTLVDEMHWDDDFSSDHCLEAMERHAKKDGVELSGLGLFDYDKYFTACYRDTEKGLS